MARINPTAGVIGFGADPTTRGERRGTGAAIGVFGQADKSVGGFGFFTGNAGVYGAARTTGVIGDGNGGPIGVEGISGGHCGVYGHLNYKTPSGDDIGVFGAAAVDLGNPHDPIGRAGVFAGAVEFIGNLTVTGDSVV